MANYLYNGIELPELPEWDKANYPCALIVLSDYGYVIHMGVKLYKKSSPLQEVGLDGPRIYYSLNEGVWEFEEELSNRVTFLLSMTTPIWSNVDILDSDGSIYLTASDPVPVPTYTARDLYKIINGKPTKLTLYKKLGGKLIPLDEHTKEVKT